MEVEGNDLHLNPFRCVDLQWFADGDPAPGSGGEPGGEPSGEPGGEPAGGGEPPTEPPVPKPPAWIAQTSDKYKKDEGKVKDLAQHKTIDGVLDRMYTAEERAPKVPESPNKYEFDEVRFPERLQNEDSKEYREQLGAEFGAMQKEVGQIVWDAISNGKLEELPKKLANFFSNRVLGYEEAARDAEAKARADGDEALKKDWKDKYDPNIEMCRRVISTFDEDGKLAADIETEGGLANKPSLIKFVFKVSQAMSEDILVPGSTTPPELSPQEEKQKRLGDRYPSMAKGSVEAPVPPPSANLEDLRTRYPTMGNPS